MHISVILGELANFHHLGGFGASKTINIPLGLLVFPAPGPKSPPIGEKPQNLMEFSDFHQNLAEFHKNAKITDFRDSGRFRHFREEPTPQKGMYFLRFNRFLAHWLRTAARDQPFLHFYWNS